MDKPTGRQIAAARTLAGLSQPELAERAQISVPTLKRMEASAGMAVGMPNNVDAVRRALENAGIIFVAENGEGAGVRLRKILHDAAALTDRIETIEADLANSEGVSPQTPAGGMRTLERAYKREVVKKLKNRRAKLKKK